MQVIWLGRPMTCSSWEHASSLPTSLVKDYEDGVQRELHIESFSSGGQTLFQPLKKFKTPRQPKQPRVDLRTMMCSTVGRLYTVVTTSCLFLHTILQCRVFSARATDRQGSKCNTEKDGHQTKQYTASTCRHKCKNVAFECK